MQISFDKNEGIYIAKIRFDQRDLFRKAGWRWSTIKKHWYTSDRKLVEPFKAFMDPSAREQEILWQSKIGQHVELSKKLELDNDVDLACPEGQKYDAYQKVAIIYARNKRNILLADPPGLGKTIEAIGMVNDNPKTKRVLIICEASHKIHWMREFTKWRVNKDLFVGVSETKKESYKDEGKTKYKSVPYWSATPVVIVNYHQVEVFEKQLKEINWDYLLIDEAQYLTNPEAAITSRILGDIVYKKGSKNRRIPAERTIFITGTPMLGKPKKMFTFARVCDPSGLGKNYMNYADRYCDGHMSSFGYDDTGASNLEELQEKLRANFMIRRSKQEALKDLPDKRRYPFILPKDGLVKLINRESNAYSAIKDALLQYEINLGLKTPDEDVSLEVIANLYQYIEEKFGDPSDINFKDIVTKYSPAVAASFEELATARMELALAKVPMVKKISQEIINNGEKLLMFCIHKQVAAALREEWPGCCFVTGSVPANRRQAEIDRFQDDPECTTAIGNIFAMGKGYTMTAARHADFLEMSLVADHNEQAEDRAWRRGQKNAVNARYFVVEDTQDIRNVELFMEKLEINRKGLDYD